MPVGDHPWMRIFLALLALLLGGCGFADLSAPTTRVRLELSPTADFREAYRATLQGGLFCGEYDLGGAPSHQEVRLTDEQLRQVLVSLNGAGLLALTDADSGEPEAEVLYTRLEVTCGGLTSLTRWRGLPESQGRIAQALLDSPLGPQIYAGLQAVRQRKAELGTR